MKITPRLFMYLAFFLGVFVMQGCAPFKSSYAPLLPAVAAEPLTAQQQWQVTLGDNHYPLLAVVERDTLGYTLVLTNNFGVRLATVTSRGGAPVVETHLRHPVNAQWLRLVQTFQWAFWPPEALVQQNGILFEQTSANERVFSSGIVRAKVNYPSDQHEAPIWQSWQGQAHITTAEFSLFIQSVVVTY